MSSPRTHVYLPGFTFDGHGEGIYSAIFGHGVPFDVYRRKGGKTAELRTWEAQEMSAHPDDPHARSMAYSRRNGAITVFVRVRP